MIKKTIFLGVIVSAFLLNEPASADQFFSPPQKLICQRTSVISVTCHIPYPTNKYFVVSAFPSPGHRHVSGVYTFHQGNTYGYDSFPQDGVSYTYCLDSSCNTKVSLGSPIYPIAADIFNPHWVKDNGNYSCTSSLAFNCPYTNTPYLHQN